MFFILSKIGAFFFDPSHFAIFLVAGGAALLYTRWRSAGRTVTALGAMLLLLMGFGPLGYWLAAPLEARFPAPPDDMPAPDGIIVLGGTADELLSAQLNRPVLADAAERLTAPIVLKRKYPNARVVFTGGSATMLGATWTEADVVRRFWRDLGLDQDKGDVLYEDRSRNTFENAIFTRDLVQPKPGERWLLVTSAIHMPRSVGIFRKADFPVIAYPVDYRTNMRMPIFMMPRVAGRAINLVDFGAHEWAGLLAYWLTGKSNALLPAP